MLSGKLSLHDVPDVEAFCIRILRDSFGSIPQRDHEDCLAFFIETTWELSVDFQPGGIRFSTWARTTLSRRLVDWKRQQYGRTKWTFSDRIYERPLPSFVPLEDRRDGADNSQLDNADSGGVPDLLGLQRARGSTQPGSDEEASGAAHGRAA